MDDTGIGILGWSLIAVGGLIAAIGITGASLYASDYGLEATVVGGTCTDFGGGGFFGSPPEERTITVETKMFGIEHTLKDVPTEQCALIQKDNFVRYHIQSERTILWESEGGNCLYDTHEDFPSVCGD